MLLAPAMKKPSRILLVIGLTVVCGFLLLQQRARKSQRELFELLPQITAITLYDIQDRAADSNALASAASAQFPVEAFRRAGASATSSGSVALSKGSSLAVCGVFAAESL